MRIGIDFNGIAQKGSGVHTYTFNLVKGFARLNSGHRFLLFFNSVRNSLGKEAAEVLGFENITLKRFKVPYRILNFCWRRLGMPSVDTLLGGIDLYHTLDWLYPPQSDSKSVTTVFDLGWMRFPEYYSPQIRKVYKEKQEVNTKRADAIIAISNHTKRDLVEYFDIPPEKIKVTHLAANEEFRKIDDVELIRRFKERHSLEGRYIIYLGNFEPRKNLIRLIKAFSILPKEVRNEFKLVIAGDTGKTSNAYSRGTERWLYKEVQNMIGASKLHKNIISVGHLPLEDTVALMNGAELFVFPSIYEGFGIPVLEAMKCGVPVASSKASSLEEVVGEAGLVFNPFDVEEMSHQIQLGLTDSNLRSELIKKGFERSTLFSWDRCARETLAVYNEMLMQ